MFGTNTIAKPSDYRFGPNELKVTSIFYTIQGELPFQGEPALFIRLTGCQLQCSFCDASFEHGDVMSFADIGDAFAAATAEFHATHATPVPSNLLVVVTGGEPMLQANLPAFLIYLHEAGYRTQIESNGLLLRDIPDSTTLVVSPKVNARTGLYGSLPAIQRADVLKFVVSSDPTNPHHLVPGYAAQFRQERGAGSVLVSPMNVYAQQPTTTDGAGLAVRSTEERVSFWTEGLLDRTQNQANHEYAAQLAMQHGYRLNLQVHLYASLP